MGVGISIAKVNYKNIHYFIIDKNKNFFICNDNNSYFSLNINYVKNYLYWFGKLPSQEQIVKNGYLLNLKCNKENDSFVIHNDNEETLKYYLGDIDISKFKEYNPELLNNFNKLNDEDKKTI